MRAIKPISASFAGALEVDLIRKERKDEDAPSIINLIKELRSTTACSKQHRLPLPIALPLQPYKATQIPMQTLTAILILAPIPIPIHNGIRNVYAVADIDTATATTSPSRSALKGGNQGQTSSRK